VTWRVITTFNGTLGDAERFPGCKLLVTCNACGHLKSYSPGRVVMRLRELRLGGTLATLEEVARRIERPCPCGQRAWRAELAWPPGLSASEIKRLAARARP
jgi:hypothetical protein